MVGAKLALHALAGPLEAAAKDNNFDPARASDGRYIHFLEIDWALMTTRHRWAARLLPDSLRRALFAGNL